MQNGRRGRGGAGHRSVGPVRSRVQNACFEGSLLLWEAERVEEQKVQGGVEFCGEMAGGARARLLCVDSGPGWGNRPSVTWTREGGPC